MGDAYVVVDFDDNADGTGAKAFAAAVRCIRATSRRRRSTAFRPRFSWHGWAAVRWGR